MKMMARGLSAVIVGVAVGFLSAPMSAQVVATQGSEANQPQEFASPMILELPFEDAVQLEEGATFRLKGVGAFVCEDTTLARLSVKKIRASVKRGDTYKFEGTLTVRPSQDRFVILELTIQIDGKAVSPEGRVRSHVEESNSAVFAAEVKLTPEQTALLAAGAASAKLKLRMAVAED